MACIRSALLLEYLAYYDRSMVYSHYKKLRILHLSSQGYKPPTIARMLEEEGMKASRRGIGKFLKVGRLRVDISLDSIDAL